MIGVRGETLARVVRSVLWYLRELTGESAYDRYREHHAAEHGPGGHDGMGEHGPGEPPLTRREFERRRAERSAQPGSRCC